MNSRRCFILGLLTAGWLSGQSLVAGVAPVDNPYAPIVDRNVFGLVPIPTNPPPVDPGSLIPKPKISPNGIMRLFGQLQVIFKVTNNRPGQPPKEDSYVMGEGDRQDEIEVLKIDEKAASISFNNHGEVQELPLVASAPSAGGPAAAPSGFAPSPGMTAPGMSPAAGANSSTTIGTLGGRFGRNRNLPAPGNPGASGTPGFGSATAAPSGTQPEAISPEAQVIMMEAQRAEWQQKGNPAAAIIPRTALTPLLEGDGSGNSGPPIPGQ